MSTWFSRIKASIEGLFRDKAAPSQSEGAAAEVECTVGEKTADRGLSAEAGFTIQPPERVENSRSAPKSISRSAPYALVVGLDFGTAYTKAVVRDSLVPGCAYAIPFRVNSGWSYLVPSVVYCEEQTLFSAFDAPIDRQLARVEHLKMRLVSEADRSRAGAWNGSNHPHYETVDLTAWFLAQVLAHTGCEIRRIWADFGEHPADACFVNLCVPIAYARSQEVESAVLRALCAAYNSVGPGGSIAPDIGRVKRELYSEDAINAARAYCYTYPETSANLQSFLRSRSRQPGLYLFIDVGAGTMDLSFFVLHEDSQQEKPLIYLHGSVLDVGSARIEIDAVRFQPDLDIDEVRAHKEDSVSRRRELVDSVLASVRKALRDEVARGVGVGVREAESRMNEDTGVAQNQMRRVNLLFAGGGFCVDPYEFGARHFHRARQWMHEPPGRELPAADDLRWPSWVDVPPVEFKRLSVAYGLSFPRFELEEQKYPDEVLAGPRPDKPAAVEHILGSHRKWV